MKPMLVHVKGIGEYHFFSENFGFFEIFWNFLKFFEKILRTLSEIRNLNFVTSELDSESLSMLRKIMFKRDSCKEDVGAAPVITSCAKNV